MAKQIASVHIVDNSDKIKNASIEAIEKALTEIGMTCETYAKRDCPVDTGNLRNSISYDVNESKKYVEIGTAVTYGKFQETGTSRMRAQPFLKPAATEHSEEYKSIVARNMKNA